MNFFCSKDCPDLCAARITAVAPEFKVEGIAEPWSAPGFVCAKFKTFARREINNGLKSWQSVAGGPYEYATDQDALTALAAFLEPFRKKKILFQRGSGSLAYNMYCWDQLFASFGNCWNVSGGPCDDTGTAAHIADFGVLANPDITGLENAATIIIYGRNAAATSPHLYAYLKKLRQAGKKIIYIDPVKTRTADLAERFILINPGCDGLLACALLVELGYQNGYNAAALCATAGVSTEDFADLLACIRSGKTAHIQGSGLQRQGNGMNAFRWINRLAVKTGMQDLLFWGHSSKRLWEKPHANFAGQVHIDQLATVLADGEFDLFVNVAANPLMTMPDVQLWRAGMSATPSLVIGTNHDETAQQATFFLKVGGMFAQSDFMASNFFSHNYSRTNLTSELSDVDAATLLANKLRLPLKIKERAQIKKTEMPQRTYRTQELNLTMPESQDKLQLLTASHASYLNSQTLPGMEQGLQVVHINTADAIRLSITTGDQLRVIGTCGEFVAAAAVTDDIAQGTLMCWKNIPMKEGFTNNAIPNRLTDSGDGLALYAVYVEIEKV